MILQALNGAYERFSREKVANGKTRVPPYCYSYERIGYALVLDKSGQPRRMGDGSYHHDVSGSRGGQYPRSVEIAAYGRVAGPEQRALHDEIAALKAERDRLAAQIQSPATHGDGDPGEP